VLGRNAFGRSPQWTHRACVPQGGAERRPAGPPRPVCTSGTVVNSSLSDAPLCSSSDDELMEGLEERLCAPCRLRSFVVRQDCAEHARRLLPSRCGEANALRPRQGRLILPNRPSWSSCKSWAWRHPHMLLTRRLCASTRQPSDNRFQRPASTHSRCCSGGLRPNRDEPEHVGAGGAGSLIAVQPHPLSLLIVSYVIELKLLCVERARP
jgi:hypothetical protein